MQLQGRESHKIYNDIHGGTGGNGGGGGKNGGAGGAGEGPTMNHDISTEYFTMNNLYIAPGLDLSAASGLDLSAGLLGSFLCPVDSAQGRGPQAFAAQLLQEIIKDFGAQPDVLPRGPLKRGLSTVDQARAIQCMLLSGAPRAQWSTSSANSSGDRRRGKNDIEKGKAHSRKKRRIATEDALQNSFGGKIDRYQGTPRTGEIYKRRRKVSNEYLGEHNGIRVRGTSQPQARRVRISRNNSFSQSNADKIVLHNPDPPGFAPTEVCRKKPDEKIFGLPPEVVCVTFILCLVSVIITQITVLQITILYTRIQ